MADEEVIQSESSECDDTGAPVSNGCHTATEVAPVKRPKTPDRKPRQLPPYRVLLHNDDVNSFEHVIVSIVRITTLAPQEAVLRTLEAHEAGTALLLVTHLERAELYQEQFTSTGLSVTIEPAQE